MIELTLLATAPSMETGVLDHTSSYLAAAEFMTEPQGLIWASGANAEMNTEHQTVFCGNQVSFPSGNPKTNIFVVNEPIPSQEQAKGEGAITTKTKRKKYSDTYWEMLRETYLRRLYLQESHTVDEVVFEMRVIHGHTVRYVTYFTTCPAASDDQWLIQSVSKSTLERKFKFWEFSKNNSKCQVSRGSVAQRRRTAFALPPTSSSIKDLMFASMNEARRKLDIQRSHPGPPPTYIQQEKIFHALDQLVKGLFASGSRGWKPMNPQSTNFTSPDFAFGFTAPDWQLVAEKCRCVAILVDMAQYGEAFSIVEDAMFILQSATQLCNPSFLVHFWNISLTLMGVRLGHRRSFPLFRSFLLHLQVILSSSVGANHPMTDFVASLAAVTMSTPTDLKTTLGLACWKTIHVLGSILGQEHAIVLNLTTYCARNWKSRFSPDEEAIASSYHRLGASSSFSTRFMSEDDVSFHFDRLLAIVKPKNNVDSLIQQAVDIWTVTKDRCCKKPRVEDTYDLLSIQAFAFTTEILASHHIEKRGQNRSSSLETGYGYLREGIETLVNGSKEHQIHAMVLSKRLESYLKASHGKERAMKERERGTQLRLRIKKMLTTSAWVSGQAPRDRPKTGGAWAKKNRQSRRESRQKLTLLLDNKRPESR